MKRYIMYSELKPEKVQEYVELHANPWPEILDIIRESNIRNYSISINGNRLLTYYEYVGTDFEADNKKMDDDPYMQKWRSISSPCFKGHEEGKYYEDFTEIFYTD